MKKKSKNYQIKVAFLLCFFFFSGCGIFNHSTGINILPEEYEAICAITNRNKELETIKGNAKLKITGIKKETMIFKASFAFLLPDKMRIILLNGFNTPAAGIASDGDFFTMLSYSDEKYYKKKIGSGFDLKKLLGIPIKPEDLVLYMTGNASIGEEKIYLDKKNRTKIRKIERYDRYGKKIYTVTMSEYESIQGFETPFEIEISDMKNRSVHIEIRKYIVNAEMKKALFRIVPLN